MCKDIVKTDGIEIKMWAPLNEVEPQALQQLKNIAVLPWAFHHVASMADCHYGKGATVGSVIAMKDAVSPAAVGVDIGCGMAAVKTSLKASDLPESLRKLRYELEKTIPVGFNCHTEPALLKSQQTELFIKEFGNLHDGVQGLFDRALLQIGTLGGGNHFIELCLDTEQSVWMMLHSGSRRIGKELADIHITKAKTLAHNEHLPDRDLAVFLAKTQEMEDYRRDLYWAQRYALLNRKVMLEIYRKAMRKFFPQVTFGNPIHCHHNYVSEETHFGEEVFVTRKGAISADVGRMGIIPGSMGAKSFIVEGLGNPDSFNSASHGAGRRMSRGQAKRTFSIDDLERQTEGVECRKDKDIIDEIPSAYKDIEAVMENQKDLVSVVAEIKQILCVKG